jgi:cell surface protein SprA
MFDKLPLLQLSQPSTFSVNAEFAHLIAGHYENKYAGEYSYLDDFESTQSEFDLLNPYFWNLASTPFEGNSSSALFPEAGLTNNVDYGKNRALFAWYYIDRIFTGRRSSLRPSYITDEDISNHYVRAVLSTELFPDRDLGYNEDNYLNVLNLAYYPTERGPYNLDAENINSDGSLMNPEKRWGGVMRNLDQTDFEAANIQYIEFWMMDPFIYNPDAKGGDLYFNLGEISEDILKDEKKFFENGLPIDGNMSQVDTTVWGKVPLQQSTVYAFDNTAGARALQDVGFNGLSSEEERNGQFPAYAGFLSRLAAKLSQETLLNMRNDPFSSLNDPAADDYHHFRGSDYDDRQLDILSRYKRYNGVEGNSRESGNNDDRYDSSSKMIPDAEDFNQDNTLNENEKYFRYRVSIRPQDMVVGTNHIVDKKTTSAKLPNGVRESVNWYQIKIPVREYDKTIGSISDFSSIRFMRAFMTGFNETTILRLGKFALVRGEWRQYRQPLYESAAAPSVTASMAISTVNIEENSDREPIRYVLPPGVTRITDPNQPQIRQQNEQSLSLKVTNLASKDARAIYKTTSFDLRRYKKMELFVHAEKFVDDITNLGNGELSVFIRLGSDYKNNYYEYEVPLSLTPFGSNTRSAVWPEDNKISFALETFTDLKLKRNRAKSNGESGVTYTTLYSDYDPRNNKNTIRVIGNPSFSDVQVIMIGVRNHAKDTKSAEIWVNELRVTDYDEAGGWAANATANLAISDFATINASGHIETAGFGGLDQSIAERNLDDYSQFSVAATVQLGKLFPTKAKVSLPLYYAYSTEIIAPQYNPVDQDILLKEALSNESTKAGKDSIRSFSNDVVTTRALSLNNVRLDIRSKKPMPYDPANFSFGYAQNTEMRTNPETVYETTKDYQGNLGYSYTPYVKPFRPFEKIKQNNGYTRYLKSFALSYLPSSFEFQNTVTRHYYEIQLRDLNDVGNLTSIPVSFSQNFFWDRAFEIRWNPLQNIILNLTSKTNARIEEPYMQVNRKLNPDRYQVWKDSVKQSIADLGTPLKYDQTFSLTYTPALQYIPLLDWINSTAMYQATYNWEKGAFIDQETNIGNSIRNQRAISVRGGLNFMTLYNKSPFLKKILQKNPVRNAVQNTQRKKQADKSAQPKQKVRFETVVKLNADSGTIVQHNMLTKKVLVTARRADNNARYKVSHKALDYARIQITNKDTVSLKVTVTPEELKEETFWFKVAEYSARTLMMIRSVNLDFTQTDQMMLPGFHPEIGDWLGQGPSSAGQAPGWDFALGNVSRSYIDRASENGWFEKNPDNITPAMMNATKNMTVSAVIEPAPGLRINLNSTYMDSRDTEILFMYAGMPETRKGNFNMTTIGLGGIFKGAGDARDNYSSDVFNRMIENRNIVSNRINSRYSGSKYPDAGFLAGTGYAGQEFDRAASTAGVNSSDVLIPSFIAAYTNKDPHKVGLTAFPSITSMLPNWNITYDGLVYLPFIGKHFRSMSLSHRYTGVYNVGSYTSFLNWVNAGIGGDLGYVKNTETGAPVPSMGYEIASITLNEGFDPLIGLDATFLNNMTAGIKYSKRRVTNLNVSSYQLVETLDNNATVSIGYKYAEFNKVLKIKKKEDVNNDLTVRMDYNYRKTLSLIRKLEDSYTQATQGTVTSTMQFSADYAWSKKITLRAFYDLQINRPLVSSSAYPTSNSNYGISIQVSLDQ